MRMPRGLPDDVHDAPVALLLHRRQHRARGEEEAEDLVADLPLERRQRRIVDGAAQMRTCVVDQDVDPAERRQRGADQRAHAVRIRDVRRAGHHATARRAELRRGVLQARVVARADRHRGAFGDEHLRDRLADAGGGAGDDRHLVTQSEVQAFSCFALPTVTRAASGRGSRACG